MKILAFDTSTEALSVALWQDGASSALHESAPRRHAELLLPWCERLLVEADIALGSLDAIAFGCGPGAFTGVRIAVSAAQGMGFAADLPLVPVSSLAATAEAARADGLGERLIAAFDARMGEVYWGAYQATDDGLDTVLDDALSQPAEVQVPGNDGWTGVGPGFASHGDDLRKALGARLGADHGERLPHASATARLGALSLARGGGVTPERAEPVYLRDQVTRRG